MENIPVKVDGVDRLPAAEWNQLPAELETLITSTGQTLSGGILDQISKASAIYAAGGNFYTDSGIADAYVLTVVGAKKAPVAYFNGMSVRFLPGNVNGGGAATVNVASLGVKNIKLADGATDPAGGDIPLSSEITLTYDGTNFRLTANIAISIPPSASTTVEGLVELATDAEVQIGTDTARVPSVSSMIGHQGMAKAWIVFDGQGTPTILDSFNISSLVDEGTGQWTINFTTAFGNAFYTYAGTGEDDNNASGNFSGDIFIGRPLGGVKTTSAIRIHTMNGSGTLKDLPEATVVFFGDQ